MSKFLVAGIVQKETIVKVDKIPIEYSGVTNKPNTIFINTGGDAYNESLALKWLGNSVDLMSMIGISDSMELINPKDSEVKLETDYILPRLYHTPTAVVFYDDNRNQQVFEDIKDLRDIEYDLHLFKERAARAEMLILSNANFCRPLIEIGKELRKPIAVNIREYNENKIHYNEDYLKAADILYVSDDHLIEEPYEFVKSLAAKYRPEIIILGQGAEGLILYDKNKNIIAHYNTVRTHGVVNTVGAGNALFSCFLHFYNKTKDSVFAVKNALLFASYKIGFMGTSNGFMTEEQIVQWRNLIWRDGR
ncbi:carbohydrate kinase family protein [Kineothrix sp. MB12-C1]|uniref:carbohydrate kinase family protein n=1 Tax=Kineothrix sp. MB12-C1 TaxID=3070215 RepID=UPI0027D326EA|nr:carbohydrate kinase family protein [Kineothrix sp. MB12-C1]WMC91855.1 carbohydrate kinase family protein [Kineothrix sp. MB12-C1]